MAEENGTNQGNTEEQKTDKSNQAPDNKMAETAKEVGSAAAALAEQGARAAKKKFDEAGGVDGIKEKGRKAAGEIKAGFVPDEGTTGYRRYTSSLKNLWVSGRTGKIAIVVGVIIALYFLNSILSGGDSESISLVKNGTWVMDESLTVGGALEGYEYFDKFEWSEREDSQGRRIVEFRGYPALDKLVDLKGDIDANYLVQFSINVNGDKFDVKYSGLEVDLYFDSATGEQKKEEVPDDLFLILYDIYSNSPDQLTSMLSQNSIQNRLQRNEFQAIGNLKIIVGAQVAFASAERGYSGDFKKLTSPNQGTPYLDIDLSVPFGGYKYTLKSDGDTIASSSGGDVFTNFICVAIPEKHGRTGIRSFFVDASGVIRFADDDSVPDETSEPISYSM